LELERQQLRIEEDARKELQFKETEKAITMKLEGDVLFDFGRAEIKPEAKGTLDKVGTVIAQFPEGKVLIEGHTDSKGSPNANLELSKRRAEAVKNWLVKNKGVPESIITIRGVGETAVARTPTPTVATTRKVDSRIGASRSRSKELSEIYAGADPRDANASWRKPLTVGR
jgi:outer membrane protein OmpA-like peptidoglycan-associated protein